MWWWLLSSDLNFKTISTLFQRTDMIFICFENHFVVANRCEWFFNRRRRRINLHVDETEANVPAFMNVSLEGHGDDEFQAQLREQNSQKILPWLISINQSIYKYFDFTRTWENNKKFNLSCLQQQQKIRFSIKWQCDPFTKQFNNPNK